MQTHTEQKFTSIAQLLCSWTTKKALYVSQFVSVENKSEFEYKL